MNNKFYVPLDLPDAELYSIINYLRTLAIKQRATKTDEEIQEDLDCRVAGLNQIAGELAETGDILGEDREWLLSLLNSSKEIKPQLEKIRYLEDLAFQRVTVTPLFNNICTILDWVEEGIMEGNITPQMEERLVDVEVFLERMVA